MDVDGGLLKENLFVQKFWRAFILGRLETDLLLNCCHYFRMLDLKGINEPAAVHARRPR